MIEHPAEFTHGHTSADRLHVPRHVVAGGLLEKSVQGQDPSFSNGSIGSIGQKYAAAHPATKRSVTSSRAKRDIWNG
jgi:hypothetical protein